MLIIFSKPTCNDVLSEKILDILTLVEQAHNEKTDVTMIFHFTSKLISVFFCKVCACAFKKQNKKTKTKTKTKQQKKTFEFCRKVFGLLHVAS